MRHHTFIGKVVFICLVGSVNSVLKFLGQPGETRLQPGGDEISLGVPMTFNTKLNLKVNKDYVSFEHVRELSIHVDLELYIHMHTYISHKQ